MRTSALLLASLILSSSSVALAQGPSQDESATAPTPTTAAQAPVVVQAAPAAPAAPVATAPVVRAPEAPANAVRCELGEVARIDPDTARGWLTLLCQEIVKQEPRPGVYRLHAYRLDKTVLLRLSAERGGITGASEQIQIASADELPVVGPRLVRAVVQNKPFAETATVDSVSRSEARVPEKKPGTFLLGGGVFGAAFAGTEHGMVPAGLNLSLAYETNQFAAVADARAVMAGNERDSDQYKVSWASISVGGRYFLGDGDITPLLGLGFLMGGGSESKGYGSFWGIDTSGSSNGWKRSGSGAGAYLEAGVEALRLHNGGRLLATVRAELPFFQMRAEDSSTSNSYMLPLTFGAAYYFR